MWAARAGIPFAAFDYPEWKAFMAYCGKSVRSGDTLRRELLPSAAAFLRKSTKEALQSAPAAAVVIDGWDLRRKKVIGIVLHRITQSWKLRTEVLGLVRAHGSQTGVSIATMVSARIHADLGPDTMVAAAVSDNGGNYVKASERIAGGEHWPCVLHTLQLAVHDALEENTHGVRAMLDLVHNIVVAVRDSPARREALESAQLNAHVPVKQLALENDTRWHSQLAMLESFVQTYPQLVEIQAHSELTSQLCALASDILKVRPQIACSTDCYYYYYHYHNIIILMQVLTAVRIRSRTLEADSVVTLSLVLPTLRELLQDLEPQTRDSQECAAFKRALSGTVSERFDSLFTATSLAHCATALDPRTSNLPGVFHGVTRDAVWAALETEAAQLKLQAGVTSGMLVCWSSRPLRASCSFLTPLRL